jgi:hypothetical protein
MTCENMCQGYNTWNDFECRGEMSAQGIVAVADSLLDSGLFAAGYLFLNDDHLAVARCTLTGITNIGTRSSTSTTAGLWRGTM